MTQDTFAFGPGGPAPIPSATSTRLFYEVLGGPQRFTISELSERSGLSQRLVTDFWRWMGMPVTDPEAALFTDSDVAALREFSQLIASEHLGVDTMRSIVRAIGHNTERLASWEIEAFVEHLANQHKLDDLSARRSVLDNFPHQAGLLGRISNHVWRRQLVKVLERYARDFGDSHDSPPDSLPFRRAVGFADIVGFTRRTSGFNADELAAYIDDFETKARDIITEAGGVVVKTVGDAVLFMAEEPHEGAEVALGLAEQSNSDDVIPVRVGMVWGRVLSRFGDVFGPSVNLASRLTDLAEPGGVLIDPGTAALIGDDHKYLLTEQIEADIKGLETMRPVKLERA